MYALERETELFFVETATSVDMVVLPVLRRQFRQKLVFVSLVALLSTISWLF